MVLSTVYVSEFPFIKFHELTLKISINIYEIEIQLFIRKK